MSREKSNIAGPDGGKPLNMGVDDDSADCPLEVEKLAAGGRGVARSEGRVWFVRGGIPGDRLMARVERERPRFVEARAVRIEQPSPLRRKAPCPHQARCGGCPWMVLDEPAQREWKQRIVQDALERLGGLSDPVIEPVRPVSQPLGYRNRVEFSAGAGPDGAAAIGLWGETEGSRALVDIPHCPLQTDAANRVLARIRDFVARHPNVATELVEHGPFRVLIRSGSGGGMIVGLWGAGRAFPGAEELAAELAAPPGAVESVVRLDARPGRRGGVRTVALHGDPCLDERLGDMTFSLPAASFMQVNPDGGDALIRLVVELAGRVSGLDVLDLFGGAGAFGLHLARVGARRVTVCDADRDAVKAGRAAARSARLAGVEFVHATARAYLRSRQGRAPAVIVANPPRSGFGKGIATGLAALSAARVVLVSCDPPTLARDLKPFLSAGYSVKRTVPVDLFPQTPHVETVLLLTLG